MEVLQIDSMNILVRLEEEKDYSQVEEVTKLAFSYPERIERGKLVVLMSIGWYHSCFKYWSD